METETLLIALVSAAITLVLTILFQRHFNKQHQAEIRQRDEQIQALEKQAFQKERDFLEARNRTELVHQENIREAKKTAFEEGRQRGVMEHDVKHQKEVIALQAECAERVQVEREKAAAEAREKLRAEYELQSKLFSVQISPLVRVTENKKMFSAEYLSEVGYQYQLLVNGIPAFQPHVIIERTESRKEINEARIQMWENSAKKIADAAINMYLGANGQFAKIAAPITKRLKK